MISGLRMEGVYFQRSSLRRCKLSNVDLTELQDRLLQAFPPAVFDRVVSTHDECDEGIALLRELPGKSWTEVSAQFVDDNSLSLPLLEPAALVAFLPAWLRRSIETFHRDSLVLEFALYFLVSGNEDDGWDDEEIAELADLFDSSQRAVVGDWLQQIRESHELCVFHEQAFIGLRWWRT